MEQSNIYTNIFFHGKVNHYIFHEYQTIIDLKTEDVFGYEALVRSNNEYNPFHLIQTARKTNVLFKLDTISIKVALIEMKKSLNSNFFINIFPSTVIHPNFQFFLDELLTIEKENRNKIIFELNEENKEHGIWSILSFKERIEQLRKNNFKIALDDVGTAAASLINVIEFEPDFIKLDKYFAKSLDKSSKKQKIIQLFAQNKNNETKIILEGIETKEDLIAAKELGVDLGQGYFISKPEILQVHG